MYNSKRAELLVLLNEAVELAKEINRQVDTITEILLANHPK
jgi:hypothetical protein